MPVGAISYTCRMLHTVLELIRAWLVHPQLNGQPACNSLTLACSSTVVYEGVCAVRQCSFHLHMVPYEWDSCLILTFWLDIKDCLSDLGASQLGSGRTCSLVIQVNFCPLCVAPLHLSMVWLSWHVWREEDQLLMSNLQVVAWDLVCLFKEGMFLHTSNALCGSWPISISLYRMHLTKLTQSSARQLACW